MFIAYIDLESGGPHVKIHQQVGFIFLSSFLLGACLSTDNDTLNRHMETDTQEKLAQTPYGDEAAICQQEEVCTEDGSTCGMEEKCYSPDQCGKTYEYKDAEDCAEQVARVDFSCGIIYGADIRGANSCSEMAISVVKKYYGSCSLIDKGTLCGDSYSNNDGEPVLPTFKCEQDIESVTGPANAKACELCKTVRDASIQSCATLGAEKETCNTNAETVYEACIVEPCSNVVTNQIIVSCNQKD